MIKENPLVCFLVSHDGRVLVDTTLCVGMIASHLRRPLITRSTRGLGQAVQINGMLRGFKLDWKQEGWIRALWIEDDIQLDCGQAQELAMMIQLADASADEYAPRGFNIVSPYATGQDEWGRWNWVYFKKPSGEEIGRPFTIKEIQSLQPYDRLDGLAGLGFYYGDVNLEYIFYEGTYNGKDRFGLPSYSGIDWNYFLDNNIDLRHYPVRIIHEKQRNYGNAEALGIKPRKMPKKNRDDPAFSK
jgi:hypothetical protein